MVGVDPKKRVRDWYLANAGITSKKLKKDYQSDPLVRELKIARSKDYREKRKAGAVVERVYHRHFNGKDVETYSIGYVADSAGTYTQMLINFERRKWIPRPLFTEHHRLYTKRQMIEIKKVVTLYKELLERDMPRKAFNFLMQDNCIEIARRWSTWL